MYRHAQWGMKTLAVKCGQDGDKESGEECHYMLQPPSQAAQYSTQTFVVKGNFKGGVASLSGQVCCLLRPYWDMREERIKDFLKYKYFYNYLCSALKSAVLEQ